MIQSYKNANTFEMGFLFLTQHEGYVIWLVMYPKTRRKFDDRRGLRRRKVDDSCKVNVNNKNVFVRNVSDYPSWISLAHQVTCSLSHLLTKTLAHQDTCSPSFSPLYIIVCFIVK